LVLRYKKRVKRHFGSYRLILPQLSTLGYLDIDDFVTEIIPLQRIRSLGVLRALEQFG